MYQSLQDQLKESRYIRRSMKVDESDSGFERWRRKPILKTRDLPLCENFDNLRNIGFGTMHKDFENTKSGKGSIRLDFPNSTEIIAPNNRGFGKAGFMYPVANENLYEYNRISFWAYAEPTGLGTYSVKVSLHNAGEHIMPVPGRFEGTHDISIKPGEWTQIIWELPDIYRDKVTGISFGTVMNGSPVNALESRTLYIDDLRLEVVEPEKSRGWDLPVGSIAYCHSGYLSDARKQALVQGSDAETFTLTDDKDKIVYTGKVQTCENGFGLLDFTDFETPGFYTVTVGDISSKPFTIGPDAFLGAAWKSLSFFFTERCGFEVPELHIECHLDTFCKHPDGRTVPIHGGWHDAADLSQAIDKTADVIVAMLDLGDATRETQPDLSDRVLEEARWGLNWAMRTRFGDGYRHASLTKAIWTKNYCGDKDDMTGEAKNTAIHNYTAAYTCAYGAPFYKWDRNFYEWCVKCAGEDFFFAEDTIETSNDNSLMSERIAVATSAAAMLYRVTGETRFLDAAANRARQLAQCQQLERRTDFSLPLHGYFYEDRDKTRPISFYHRSYEHFFMKGFTLLLADAPDHPDAGLWRQCVDAYTDYIKETAHVMEPYGILPAGVYEVGNTDYSKMSHEGAKDIGGPTVEEYNAQVKNGIKLNEKTYLRRFPVSYQFRGFHATLLSKAKNVFALARFLGDRELYDIAARQLEYVLGFNPFVMSTMYGEGYDYPLLNGGYAGQPVGAVPVGFETFENDDEPYMPMQSSPTYKEIWVCSTARVMWSIAEVYKGI
ncbi:N-terminal ig-like domain of cellulase [Paenibacillus sp. 1_12]|uniref:glycoside hydrolase family 9 protein n=1 Tax=Paenibacillus sp. 1_12 TaxID=1566278 RepID=UPI0008E0645A|nr:glycoside hydrolase family 9 protein [Paenibacillus sp. 1_12]SFM47560.1 N-terminal ig-like domain of cellulase [Paenibacillus sp. 1_12]